MELAGIVPSYATDSQGMADEVQWYDTVEGFESLLQYAEESDEDVEELDSINKRNGNLYPGNKYKGMYAGEHMSENIDYIDFLNGNSVLDISDDLIS